MVRRTEVRQATLDGVRLANKRYETWSRGAWVSDVGIEGHVVSTICNELHGLVADGGSVEMEMSFGDIRYWSNARAPRGRPRASLNARNRADIVILKRDWRPVCVIEVKRVWNEDKCLDDLVRIRNLILKCGHEANGSLRMGFLTFLLVGWGTDAAEARECLREQRREIQNVLNEFDPEELNLRCRMGAMRGWPQRHRKLYAKVLEEEQWNWVHAAFCVELWCR